jgi:hypothetical protein
MRKSRFDNPKFMERRRRVLERNPHLALCYPWCTPEDEAEFYRQIGNGPVSFTRPGGFPPAAKAEPGEQTSPPAGPRSASKPRTGR